MAAYGLRVSQEFNRVCAVNFMGLVMLTQARVKEVLLYEPDTGVLTWRIQRGRQKAGSRAGRVHHTGYREVVVDNVLYREHRVIWLWMTGSWPDDECEHKNHNRSDNRWENLRAATRAQNMQNLSSHPRNTSGYVGVSFHKVRGKWRANIRHLGKSIHLGHFDTAQEANLAYIAAKQKWHTFSQPKQRAAQSCPEEYSRLQPGLALRPSPEAT
jgi:hypothetical protein